MAKIRSEEEVNMIIENMKNKTKGKYITQGVSLDKNSKTHMEILKNVLMYSSSFSGLVKELLANKFDEVTTTIIDIPITHNNEVVTTFNHIEEESNNLNDEPNTNSSIGNFF